MEPAFATQPPADRIPLPLKIFAVLLIGASLATLPAAAFVLTLIPHASTADGGAIDPTTRGILLADIALTCIACVLGIILGLNLLYNQRRHARQFLEALIAVNAGVLLCQIMVSGIGQPNVSLLVRIALYIALSIYIDPSLSRERKLRHKLRRMEDRKRAQKGTLGLDESGKGYIELNFFNLFWIFTVCCVLGVIIETVYVFFMTGHYQNRTGMLFGPFSPIYGLGAVLMTLALNRFHRSNVVLLFLVSALIGGAFEYAVSWFLQFAFGIVAWDYTGQWLSIGGRTCGKYMIFWGLLGCAWVKLLLPRLLELINKIPWSWRYGVTTVCAALMLANASLTLMALDCWYQREAGLPTESAVERFMAKEYDNEFMANHFQAMTLHPEEATRAK